MTKDCHNGHRLPDIYFKSSCLDCLKHLNSQLSLYFSDFSFVLFTYSFHHNQKSSSTPMTIAWRHVLMFSECNAGRAHVSHFDFDSKPVYIIFIIIFPFFSAIV